MIDANTIAAKYIGLPYTSGGRTVEGGLGCYGLIRLMARDRGVELPDICDDTLSLAELANYGDEVPVAAMQPWDVLIFRADPDHEGAADHVGIYLGGGEFIHTNAGVGHVHKARLIGVYRRKLIGAWRMRGAA